MGSVNRVQAQVGGNKIALDTFSRSNAPPPSAGDQLALSVQPRDLIVPDA